MLSGKRDPATLAFRPPDWYAEHDVELLLGERATSLDPVRRRVALASGSKLRFDSALIATGSRPRTLPGVERFANADTLRTVEDAERIRDGLSGGGPLVVIGAGFIGLEVAATARRLGLEVTVIEAAPAPLMRVLGPDLGNWFAELHRAEGVELLTSAQIERIGGARRRAEWVELENGRRIACNTIVVGVGIEPDTEWLEGTGFDPDGVRVYPSGRAAAPSVYAAGDAARVLNPDTGEYERCEHWESAAEQGARVGRSMLGVTPAPRPLPAFWTDQFGVRVRTIGDLRAGDAVEIDGDPSSRDFTAVVLREGKAVAGFIAGRPRALPELRRRIQTSADEEVDDGVLA